MRLKLKKDLIIPKGHLFDDIVPESTTRSTSAFVLTLIEFGRNATGELYVGHEMQDEEFQEWFEEV